LYTGDRKDKGRETLFTAPQPFDNRRVGTRPGEIYFIDKKKKKKKEKKKKEKSSKMTH
jgi:hypothetical protein